MASELIPPAAAPEATGAMQPTDYPPDGRPILEANGRAAADTSPAPDLRARIAAFSVADGLMALIGLAAAIFRFGQLAQPPLSAAEATAALTNWQFWTATTPSAPPTSPAYFAFTNIVMALGGSNDLTARLVPAVFGLLTVLLPWLLRGRARPVYWLTAGLFLTVSPLLVAVSRAAGGDAIALFALMLLAVAGLEIRDAGRKWALVAGAALGLGLTSSPLFYTGLVALLPALFVAQAFQPAPADPIAPTILTTREERNLDRLRYLVLSAAITFLAVSTCLLLYPAGLGAALRLFPTWLGQFSLPEPLSAIFSPLLALFRYEPVAVLLGVPAAVVAVARGERHGLALSIWLGLTVVVLLLQSSVMVNAAAALLPGYLLVGLLAATLAAQRGGYGRADRRTTWLTALALLGLGALLLVAVGRFARLNLLTGQYATLIGLATLAFVLAGAAVVLAMAWENAAARRGAFVGLALLLLFWQWGSAWQLSRLGVNDPRERWVTAGTDDGALMMINLLAGISRQTANSDRDLTIFSQVDSPVLRWYLREFPGYRAGPALPMNAQADVIITPTDAEPALPNDYFGADFALEKREIPNAGPTTAADALKWWLFRESNAPVDTQRVVVWIRSDLGTAGE